MKLPAAAYSAEVATSATKAGSYGVFGEGESCRHRHRDLTTMPSVNNIAILVESMGPSRMLKKGGWGSWDDPRARATRGLRRMGRERPGALLARRTRTVKLCSFDARS